MTPYRIFCDCDDRNVQEEKIKKFQNDLIIKLFSS